MSATLALDWAVMLLALGSRQYFHRTCLYILGLFLKAERPQPSASSRDKARQEDGEPVEDEPYDLLSYSRWT